jgi:hypothetical protein
VKLQPQQQQQHHQQQQRQQQVQDLQVILSQCCQQGRITQQRRFQHRIRCRQSKQQALAPVLLLGQLQQHQCKQLQKVGCRNPDYLLRGLRLLSMMLSGQHVESGC